MSGSICVCMYMGAFGSEGLSGSEVEHVLHPDRVLYPVPCGLLAECLFPGVIDGRERMREAEGF